VKTCAGSRAQNACATDVGYADTAVLASPPETNSKPRPWLIPGLLLVAATAYLLPLTQLLYSVGDDGTLLYGAQLTSKRAIPGRDFVEVMGPGGF
jgi:hypothetical protein